MTQDAGPRAPVRGLRLAPALLVALAASLWPMAIPAERLQPDFTFRRVGVPEAGAPRRITVQIDPEAPSAIRPPDSAFGPRTPPAIAEAGAGPVAGATPGMTNGAGFDWFWAAVSPALSEGGPGRLQAALDHLDSAPEAEALLPPRMQALQDIASRHGTQILGATVGTQVSPALVLAVIAVESAGDPAAVSGAGAQGLMQLMPATAARFGVTDSLDPVQNIAGGVAYLDWLLGEFGGDPILALAGYNAGEGAVRDNGGVPPYAETRGYVPKVLTAWTVARGLCLTPPELISDGCVFNVNAVQSPVRP